MFELLALLVGGGIGLTLGLGLNKQIKDAAKEIEEEFKRKAKD